MKKNSFLELGERKSGFEIISIDWDSTPKNLTPDTLWNLWDITIKFGLILNDAIVFKAVPLYVEAYDFRTKKGVASLFVTRFSETRNPFENDAYTFTLTNKIRVSWDKTMKVCETKMIMAEADLEAMADGYFVGDKRGLMMDSMQTNEKKKLLVQNVFDKSGCVYVVPQEFDPEFALSCFDRPEILAIISVTPRVRVICLKIERRVLESEFLNKLEKLKAMGYSAQIIESMTFEEIILLKKKK